MTLQGGLGTICPDSFISGQIVPLVLHPTHMGDMSLRTHLLSELTERKNRNTSYSLRAFARDLGVGSTTLSDYLLQKRSFSKSNLRKVMENLALSPHLKEKFAIENHPSQRKQETHAEKLLLEEDTFRLISDWYYLAILNLANLKNNKADSKWISKRLGLNAAIVTEALERLYRLKLIENQNGKLKRTSKPLTTTTDIPSAAIRKYHAQNLILAEKALHIEPVSRRDFGAITMTVNPAHLSKAKELLSKTRERIADLLSDDEATEVYTLSIQLFPLLKEEDKEKL